jgi:hypothetical protein
VLILSGRNEENKPHPLLLGKQEENQPDPNPLARRSQELLARYRRGEPVPDGCPLRQALISMK